MNYGSSIIAALAAAVSFAVAAVLQQEATLSVPEDKSLTAGLLIDLLRRRKWLAGGACMLGGFGLQALALDLGPVALVQPIVVLELAFAIPLGIFRRHRHAGQREWAGIACVISGISIFLLIASPSSGIQEPGREAWLASLVPVGAVAVAGVIVGAAKRGPTRAMFLGGSAGLAFAVLSILTKSVTHVLSADPAHALVAWQVYVAIAVGIAALIVSQSAYQAGPLAYSMPFVGLLEPLVAVIIGDTVLGEQVRLSPGPFALEISAAAIACIGILLLTTSATVLSIYEEHPTPEMA